MPPSKSSVHHRLPRVNADCPAVPLMTSAALVLCILWQRTPLLSLALGVPALIGLIALGNRLRRRAA